MNWFHPFIWRHIAAAAHKYNFSAATMAWSLKLNGPELFRTVNKGTIHRWLWKDNQGNTKKAWKDRILKNINTGHAVFGTGHVGVLKPYPELVDAMKGKFCNLHKAGVPVNRLLARTIMLAMIKDQEPHLLKVTKCAEVRNMN
jgi:hypothetical protein